MKLTLYYSVQNGGDGSAYPNLMESAELCEWDQRNMDEGWGESCTGRFEVESDSPITILSTVTTKVGYLVDRYLEDGEITGEGGRFIEKFFPDGLPTFRIKPRVLEWSDDYMDNLIYVDDRLVGNVIKANNMSGLIFENMLNSYVTNIEK